MKIVKYGQIEFTDDDGLILRNFEIDGEGGSTTRHQLVLDTAQRCIGEMTRIVEIMKSDMDGLSVVSEDIGDLVNITVESQRGGK